MTTLTEEWLKMKLVVAKALQKGEVEKVHTYLQNLHRDFELSERREGELAGMLFILDIIKGRR